MNQTSPLISVILPLYNAELYIEHAVKSILNQTCTNFELIIIDDGSTDNSTSIVKKIDDKRIKLFSQENAGMAFVLNRGIQLAHGEFIARQDADDISHPKRFEKQILFLKEHPNCAMIGTWAKIFSDGNNKHSFHQHPTDNLTLKLFLLFDNPFVHSSVMMRKSILEKTGNYDIKKSSLTQDYDLWSRIARNHEVANLPETLQMYRKVASGISHTTSAYSEKVLEQSVENITFYIEKQSAADLANLYHGAYQKLRTDTSIEKIETAFNEVADQILSTNKGNLRLFQTIRKNYLNLLKKKLRRYQRFGKLLIFSRSFYKKINRYR